jgi:hypothetical protein
VFDVKCEGHFICVKHPLAQENGTFIYLIPDYIAATYRETQLKNLAFAREVVLHRQLPYTSLQSIYR